MLNFNASKQTTATLEFEDFDPEFEKKELLNDETDTLCNSHLDKNSKMKT